MIKPWPLISSTPKGDFRIFSIRSDLKQSPRTGRNHDFFVIETFNWVNVIAVTPDDKLVMVEQYRHGTNTVELELPGGVMEAGETSPVAAGVRELHEETGFRGGHARLLGQMLPNPAIMNNHCYTVVVEDCTLRSDTAFDMGEDLNTKLVPFADVPQLVQAGHIRHSIIVAALYHYDLHRRTQGK
ncbi:MAG: NUDIX hydrolase [Verrucomicrobia bacterium]|nr:NUDIX hydrolase [Verrucomicrobiota bacterium]